MKLVPLGDKIVLKQLEAEETTKSGIVLPGQAKEKPQEAEVIAVGPGGNIDGKEVTMQVKVGDKVIALGRNGKEVCKAEVTKVRTAPAFDHTNLLTIKVPNDMVMKARFYKKEA